jgi:hypothetical protein
VNLSAAFAFGLFIILPGIGAYIGIFAATQSARFRSSPPPPSSMLALAIVGSGAIVGHFLSSLAFAINESICKHVSCIQTGFEPNPYLLLLDLQNSQAGLTSWQVVLTLLWIITLTIITFLISMRWISWELKSDEVARTIIFGWLSPFFETETDDDRVVVAYALTTIDHDGASLGYQGLVDHLNLTSDKEISSIVLTEASLFQVVADASGVTRKGSDRKLETIYLDKSQIRNIAFRIVKIEE